MAKKPTKTGRDVPLLKESEVEDLSLHPVVRDWEYSERLGERIAELRAEGRTIKSIAGRDGLPPKREIGRWLREVPEFRQLMRNIKAAIAEDLIGEVNELADGMAGASKEDVPGLKGAADIKLKLAEKMNKEEYGNAKADEDRGTVYNIYLGMPDQKEEVVFEVQPEKKKVDEKRED